MVLNGLGAVVTAIVAVIFLVTKFAHGAWIILFLVPLMVRLFFTIHSHYRRVAQALSTEGETASHVRRPVQTIVLVSDVHRETMRLVEVANSLGLPWKAVHIAVNEDKVPEMQRKWNERIGMGELLILKSPYRSVTRPLHAYVKRLLRQNPGSYVHVILGELRTGNAMAQILHQNAHLIEQLALSDLDGVLTTVVPFSLETHAQRARSEAQASASDWATDDAFAEPGEGEPQEVLA